jgi:hypothetical protein
MHIHTNTGVTISSRANLLRKLGDMMCGVVVCVKDGGRHGALKCVTQYLYFCTLLY